MHLNSFLQCGIVQSMPVYVIVHYNIREHIAYNRVNDDNRKEKRVAKVKVEKSPRSIG